MIDTVQAVDSNFWYGLIALLVLAGAIMGVAWPFINNKKAAREDISKEIKAEGLEAKKEAEEVKKDLDRHIEHSRENFDMLHARANRSVEEMSKLNGEIQYQKGVSDTTLQFLLKMWEGQNNQKDSSK
jgi:F0F1-type ATP synthase membrane subunit b/b'